MSKFFSRLQKMLKEVNTWVVVMTALFTFLAAHFKLLYTRITLPLWLLFLIVLTPYVTFQVFRHYYHRQKRTYKLGDAVQIIADNRKFIVIRYHFWFPLSVVCKEENRNTILSVHQKYLTPFVEKPNTLSDSIFNLTSGIKKPPIGTTVKHL